MLFITISSHTSHAMESSTPSQQTDEQKATKYRTTPCHQNIYPNKMCPGCYRRMYIAQITALHVKRKAQSAQQ